MSWFSAKEEAVRLKFRNKIYIPFTAKKRARKLKCKDFTVISNNCWGGTVYESYGMKKLSPTVGMFIMPKDYIKFAGNLHYYLNQHLSFVKADDSKWKSELCHKANFGTYLIGKLSDIELHMLHYHEESVARAKWESRVKRVNFEKMIVKFNDQNGATPKDIEDFMQLPIKNKLCFVSDKRFCVSEGVILVKQPKRCGSMGIKASREPFGDKKHFKLTDYINALGED